MLDHSLHFVDFAFKGAFLDAATIRRSPVRSFLAALTWILVIWALTHLYPGSASQEGGVPAPWPLFALILLASAGAKGVAQLVFLAAVVFAPFLVPGEYSGGVAWGFGVADGMSLLSACYLANRWVAKGLVGNSRVEATRVVTTFFRVAIGSAIIGGVALYLFLWATNAVPQPWASVNQWVLSRWLGAIGTVPLLIALRPGNREHMAQVIKSPITFIFCVLTIAAQALPSSAMGGPNYLLGVLLLSAVWRGFGTTALCLAAAMGCTFFGLGFKFFGLTLIEGYLHPLTIFLVSSFSLLLPLITAVSVDGQRREILAGLGREKDIETIYRRTPAIMHSLDSTGRILNVSDLWLTASGYTREEVVGHNISEFLRGYGSAQSLGIASEVITSVGGQRGCKFITKDQQLRYFLVNVTTQEEAGTKYRLVVSVDVTLLVEMARKLITTTELNQVVLDSIGTAVVAMDLQGNITYFNPSAGQLLEGLTVDCLGTPAAAQVLLREQDRNTPSNLQDGLITGVCQHPQPLIRCAVATAQGDVPVRGSLAPLRNSDGTQMGSVLVLQDVTASMAATEELARMARRDALTGMGNRIALDDALQHACNQAEPGRQEFSVLLLDLDRFKQVNDSLGHTVGDALLVEVARRIQDSVRSSDTVCRFGGDEFVVVLNGNHTEEVACGVAQKIVTALGQPYTLKGTELQVSASVGVARYPAHGTNPTTLQQAADIAMYEAKHEGKNRYCMFKGETGAKQSARSAMEIALRTAVASNSLEVHYQPQINSATQTLQGLEALARWQYENKNVPPDVFIPLAEECGLMPEMGLQILRKACEQHAQWRRVFDQVPKLAVNVSALQLLDDGFPKAVAHVLAETAMAAQDLELEITESALMEQPLRTRATLERLKALGLTIALDDFGTGYSSLSYLNQFPVDVLKVDRSFVQDLGEGHGDPRIINAIVGLAKSLHLQVVAEGVETHQQRDLLVGMGCDTLQGYYYSKPRPAESVALLFPSGPPRLETPLEMETES